MARGNRNLGIVELVESLEDLLPMLRRLAAADGRITIEEQEVIDYLKGVTHGAGRLALRTQISVSMLRGTDEPPARTADLIEQYELAYGPKAIGVD